MKKIVISILLLFSFVAHANEDLPTLYSGTFPALCGETEEVKKVAKDKEMIIFSVSNGRAGANPDGELAYYITHWVQPKDGSQMFTASTVDGKDSCILFISFDTVINPNLSGNGI